MKRKIPADAFSYYMGLGASRSYAAVAQHFGVTKRAVTNHARDHDWAARLEKIEADAREKNDQKLVETLEQMNERHLKMVRAVQGKALETLRAMPLTSAMDAVRALELSVKQERLIRGEPSDRAALSIEEITKRQFSEWLIVEEVDDDEQDEAEKA